MKLEKLSDLLEINTDILKSPEKGRLLTKVKQLIKAGNKTEANADETAKDLPFTAVSVVGNVYVELKFDLDEKGGRVVYTDVDPRDIRGKNYMGGAKAIKKMQELIKEQKGALNE